MEIDRASLWLDAVPPQRAVVGYGELGRNGNLGYEGKRVTAGGRTWESALSAHPPSHLVFELDGGFASFHCQVAINEDVPARISHADFSVLADGRPVAVAPHVVAGEPPRALVADVAGARRLELRVDTSRWQFCHAVWLEPRLERDAVSTRPGVLTDCLDRAEILLPEVPLRAERCIATVVSPGFEPYLDGMLGSLAAYGGCPDALIAVFAVGASPDIDRVAACHQAQVIRCQPRKRVDATIKSVLYSAARVVEADKLLCLDADMLILGELGPLWTALDALAETSILACRDWNGNGFRDLAHSLTANYGGHESDFHRLLGSYAGEGESSLVVNDGLWAGRRRALIALDGCIRSLREAPAWIDERPVPAIRNQFVFNLALAHLRCGIELDDVYNLQLHAHDVEVTRDGDRIRARWQGREVRGLHFCADGPRKYAAVRALLTPQPVIAGSAV